ncbi:hypothetical protein [Streptomyces broussonetiae]|uniref:hypothetical protein n=1 Tax=Streptomyces broussonetiae TaxID=2686304 RepID=UPI001E3F51BE|nr:hypothetical protein [Streptomyces broussonetiae]
MNDLRPVHRLPAPTWYGRLRVCGDDLSPADWLTPCAPGHGAFGTVAGVAVGGFAAYARILHPAFLDERPVRWSAVAAARGTRVVPGSRWYEVAGLDSGYHGVTEYGLPGVRDEHPAEGPTPPDVARALVPVLTRHTTTPDRCWFGLWDGYGRRDFGHVPAFETPGPQGGTARWRPARRALADVPRRVRRTARSVVARGPGLDPGRGRGPDQHLCRRVRRVIADLLAAGGLEAHPVAAGALLA